MSTRAKGMKPGKAGTAGAARPSSGAGVRVAAPKAGGTSGSGVSASASGAAVPKASACVATTCFGLKVVLLDDLHTGSGLGSGAIDALLARDARGQPVVRWSHFKGLLLQALRDRAEALSEPEAGVQATADRLFGKEGLLDDGRATLRGRSLRVVPGPEGARESLVVSSTGREEMSRAPKEETFRQVEYLRRGTALAGELRLPGSADSADALLLQKLLRRVNRLGARRSRGDGLVQLKVETRTLQWPVPEAGGAQGLSRAEEATGDGWTTCRLVLRTLEPVCLGAIGQPGNIIPTHSHLSPGTVAGVLARWALEARWDTLADGLLGGDVMCGAAYPCPLPEDGAPAAIANVDAVPMPLSYLAPKPAGQSGGWPWWAETEGCGEEALPQDALVEPAQVKLKRPGPHDYLVTVDGQAWTRFSCPIRAAMRNDAGRSQRAQDETLLWSMEEVPEGTAFVLRLEVRAALKPLLNQALQAMRDDRHWLPIRRGGAPAVLEAFAWGEATAAGTAPAMDSPSFRIFVETDLLLRTPSLAYRTRLDTAAVRDLLAEAGAEPDVTASAHVVESVSEPVALHGWNVATGAPRLPATAIRRGSVAVVSFQSPDAARHARDLLARKGHHGLGERAGEGHGRLRVDFAPTPIRVAATPPPLDHSASEQVLVEVEHWLNRAGFPSGFTVKRWQGLREAGRRGDASSVKTWFERSQQEVKRGHAQVGATQGKEWLSALQGASGKDLAMLVELGLRAAKRAKRAGQSDRIEGAQQQLEREA